MDVISRVSQAASPALLAQTASLTGLSPEDVDKGLGAAIPAVLAALIGAADDAEAFDAVLASREATGDDAAAAASRGADQLADLVGGKAVATHAQALGSWLGASDTAAWSLLGLAGTLSLDALAAEAGDRGGAWVLGLLEGAKAQIAEATPAGFPEALAHAGRPEGIVAPPAPPPAPVRKRSWTGWLAALAAAAVLAWFGSQWLRPATSPTETTGTRPPTAVDIEAGVRGALQQVNAALGKIGDATSARTALPELAAARHTLGGAAASLAAMPPAGRAALASLVSGALPDIRSRADRVLGNPAAAAVVRPVLDDILRSLDALAG